MEWSFYNRIEVALVGWEVVRIVISLAAHLPGQSIGEIDKEADTHVGMFQVNRLEVFA